jgi:hypothetical protein
MPFFGNHYNRIAGLKPGERRRGYTCAHSHRGVYIYVVVSADSVYSENAA